MKASSSQGFLSDLDDRPERIQIASRQRAVIVQNPHNRCRNRTISAACPPPTAVTSNPGVERSAAPHPPRRALDLRGPTKDAPSLRRHGQAVRVLLDPGGG